MSEPTTCLFLPNLVTLDTKFIDIFWYFPGNGKQYQKQRARFYRNGGNIFYLLMLTEACKIIIKISRFLPRVPRQDNIL